jgi:hypothetical protein
MKKYLSQNQKSLLTSNPNNLTNPSAPKQNNKKIQNLKITSTNRAQK